MRSFFASALACASLLLTGCITAPNAPSLTLQTNKTPDGYVQCVLPKLEKHGMIIAQLATGGGKSRVARLAYARIRRKTLFLTTRGALMYQFAEACEESFGKNEVGIVGDSIWQADRPLICGMVQTLAARLAGQLHRGRADRASPGCSG